MNSAIVSKIVITIFLIMFVWYCRNGYEIYKYCGFISTYKHELAHAKKAKEYHPELEMCVILYLPWFVRMKRKITVDGITVYILNVGWRKRGQFKVSRFAVSDNFESFSAEEISETASAGVKQSSADWKFKFITATRFINVYTFLAVLCDVCINSVCKLLHHLFLEKKSWNDYDAIRFPEEFRQHSLDDKEHDYDSMVAFAEQFF